MILEEAHQHNLGFQPRCETLLLTQSTALCKGIAVASRACDGRIRVMDPDTLSTRYPFRHAFECVYAILHSAAVDCVVTLEGADENQLDPDAVQHVVVYEAYFNCPSALSSTSTSHTPSMPFHHHVLPKHHTCVAVCADSPTMVTSSGAQICIWDLHHKRRGLASDGTTHPPLLVMSINAAFPISRISVHHQWLAYSSFTELKLIELHLDRDEATQDTVDTCTRVHFTPSGHVSAAQSACVHRLSTISREHSRTVRTGFADDRRATDASHSQVTLHCSEWRVRGCHCLLHRRLPPAETVSALQLSAPYKDTLQLFVSSERQGHTYRFKDGEVKCATFGYAEELLSFATQGAFLVVVTAAGLEVFPFHPSATSPLFRYALPGVEAVCVLSSPAGGQRGKLLVRPMGMEEEIEELELDFGAGATATSGTRSRSHTQTAQQLQGNCFLQLPFPLASEVGLEMLESAGVLLDSGAASTRYVLSPCREVADFLACATAAYTGPRHSLEHVMLGRLTGLCMVRMAELNLKLGNLSECARLYASATLHKSRSMKQVLQSLSTCDDTASIPGVVVEYARLVLDDDDDRLQPSILSAQLSQRMHADASVTVADVLLKHCHQTQPRQFAVVLLQEAVFRAQFDAAAALKLVDSVIRHSVRSDKKTTRREQRDSVSLFCPRPVDLFGRGVLCLLLGREEEACDAFNALLADNLSTMLKKLLYLVLSWREHQTLLRYLQRERPLVLLDVLLNGEVGEKDMCERLTLLGGGKSVEEVLQSADTVSAADFSPSALVLLSWCALRGEGDAGVQTCACIGLLAHAYSDSVLPEDWSEECMEVLRGVDDTFVEEWIEGVAWGAGVSVWRRQKVAWAWLEPLTCLRLACVVLSRAHSLQYAPLLRFCSRLRASSCPATGVPDARRMASVVQLACWPFTDQLPLALHAILRDFPDCVLSYSSKQCGEQTRRWAVLTERLVERAGEREYTSVCEAVFMHLACTLKPQELCSLIPDNGHLHFWLRFLRTCARRHLAKTQHAEIISKAEQNRMMDDVWDLTMHKVFGGSV